MDSSDLTQLIKQYTELRTAYDLESAAYERAHAEILAHVQVELDEVSAEFRPRLTAASDKFTALEANIKAAVLANGESEKGMRWQFVFTKGRTSWDTKKLEGLIMAYPALAELRSVGEPSVSIRAVK